MPVKQIDIKQFLKLSQESPIFDVRSPSEFSHAHIPGAFSLSLFTDEQRKIIGTAYKQQSRQIAVDQGIHYFSERMKTIRGEALHIIQNWRKENKNTSSFLSDRDTCFLIHCWRGGMRSEAVAWLLSLYGYSVYTLKGGYKTFRNFALQQFEKEHQINILGGYTGSGKTEILKEMQRQDKPVIDLEKLACHKGSAFGNLGEAPQPTQEMFENLLAVELFRINTKEENEDTNSNGHAHEATIWIEDESRNIGRLTIPGKFWEQMRQGKLHFLKIPFDSRLDFITSVYGSFKKSDLISGVVKIQKKLGGMETKNAINFFLENNSKESFRILLQHYDKLYIRSLQKRENLENILINIECESVSFRNADKLHSNNMPNLVTK
jgi:tRNA 2-selenouridine synthase